MKKENQTPELDKLESMIPAGRDKRAQSCAEIEARLNAEAQAAAEAQARSTTAAADGDADTAYTEALAADEHTAKAAHLEKILAAARSAPQIPGDKYASTLAPVIEEARAINAAHLARVAALHREAADLYDEIVAYNVRLEAALESFDRDIDGYSHRRRRADGQLLQVKRQSTLDGVAKQAAHDAAVATEYATKVCNAESPLDDQ